MMRAIQSMLFVPSSKPECFAKALASGADCVCIGLEDSVPADGKVAARDAAIAALGDPKLAIRINGLTTRDGVADLLTISQASVRPPLVFIPKVEASAAIHLTQIAAIHSVFRPTVDQIAEAEAAEVAFAASGGAVVKFNAKMLEAAVMRRYRQLLSLKEKTHA
jgi:(S)-citramalyl-CoA lyase